VLGPFEAWLLLRGMRTLFVRVQRCCDNALAIARHFQRHPRLLTVLYPGLPEHPGHDIAARQMSGGFGGMLSIRLKDGEAAAVATAARVNVFKRATSLGGVESLIEHRASIEGPATPVPADLLRLSIGLENIDDLIADLVQALDYDRTVLAVPVTTIADAAADANSNDDIVTAIKQRLDQQIRPMLADRGGDLLFRDFKEGIVTLTPAGSPGAGLPVAAGIRDLLRHYIPAVSEVRLLPAEISPGDADGVLAERVQRVLDEQINPAVQHHGGIINLVEIRAGSACLRLTGGCQGCAMAHVTLRQGVEVILKQQIPELTHVIDVTDHAAGRKPYFKTRKGTT
jgi:Fe-S cluster biogenesis protein NfuA